MIWLKCIALLIVIHDSSSKLTRFKFFTGKFYQQRELFGTLGGMTCKNLADWAKIKVKSVKSNECLMLFSHPNCEGRSYEIPTNSGAALDSEMYVNSLRVCKQHEIGRSNNWVDHDKNQEELEDFPIKRVQFFSGGYDKLLWDTHISPYCTSLYPSDFKKVQSLRTEACLMLYSLPHCKGYGFEVSKLNTSYLEYFDGYTQSFRPCTKESILGEPKLIFEVTKFEYFPMPAAAKHYKEKMLTKQTRLRNNGTATIKQPFKLSLETKEKTVMSWGEMSSVAHEVSVSSTVEVEASVGIPGLGESKVSASLTAGYSYNKGKETSKGEEKQITEKKIIEVGEDVNVPACTIYVYTSYFKLMKSYPLNYLTELEVKGIQGEKQMTADQVKSKLSKKVKYLRNKDEFTVIAQGEGKIITDFEIDSGMNADGDMIPIKNCKRY